MLLEKAVNQQGRSLLGPRASLDRKVHTGLVMAAT